MKPEKIGQAKVTSQKHITIPKKVQDELGGIQQGQYVLFYQENGKIYIQKGAVKPL